MKRLTGDHRRHLNEYHGKSSTISANISANTSARSAEESMTYVSTKNIPRNSGLRVAVCDVNTNAVAAATLLSSFVLPHMKDACRCYCFDHDGDSDSDGAGQTINDECNSRSSSSGSNSSSSSSSEYKCHNKNLQCNCGGYVVLTLKLVKNAKESYIKNAVDSASIILLSAGCYDFHTVHLGANSKNERSLICRFK